MTFLSREYKFEMTVTLNKKDQHTTAMHSLKKLVKPLMRLVKNKHMRKKTLAEIQQNSYNSSLEDMRKDPVSINAADENLANEALEQRICAEMQHCPANAAIIVYQGNATHLVPVHPQQSYIPVHFARTSNGTFFWTSMDTAKNYELQMRGHLDRWAQA